MEYYKGLIKIRRRDKKLYMLFGLMIFIFLCVLIFTKENKEYQNRFDDYQQQIVYNGEVYEYRLKVVEQEILVPVDFIKDKIDDAIFVDEETSSIIITTKNKVIRFQEESLEAFVNEKPFQLSATILKEEGEWYVPASVISEFYPYEVSYDKKTQLALFVDKGKDLNIVEVVANDKAPIRFNSDKKEPIVSYATPKERMTILEERGNWLKVQKKNGEYGFIKRKHVSKSWKEQIPWKTSEDFVAEDLKGKKIHLTWEAVYSKNPAIEEMPEMPGVHVVSPTWFELKNKNGDVHSKASAEYVKWAHERGIQVWALFSNAFDPDLTNEVLNDYEKRSNVIKQLLTYAEIYNLDGINIDFEYMHLKDKEVLVQFVRELTPYLHEQGLVVSMDVTIHSTSEMWSMFYDREKLAQVVDYMAVMTYDEHPSASPVAGSVASIPWVENGIAELLDEIPKEKLLLGVPFYTRVWSETDEGVKSETLAMKYTKEFITRHALQPKVDQLTNQNYVEFYNKEKKVEQKVWFEDEHSLKERLKLVEKYDLAGVASWQRGFASDENWKVINNALEK